MLDIPKHSHRDYFPIPVEYYSPRDLPMAIHYNCRVIMVLRRCITTIADRDPPRC